MSKNNVNIGPITRLKNNVLFIEPYILCWCHSCSNFNHNNHKATIMGPPWHTRSMTLESMSLLGGHMKKWYSPTKCDTQWTHLNWTHRSPRFPKLWDVRYTCIILCTPLVIKLWPAKNKQKNDLQKKKQQNACSSIHHIFSHFFEFVPGLVPGMALPWLKLTTTPPDRSRIPFHTTNRR